MTTRTRRFSDVDAFFRDVDRLFADAARTGGFAPRADVIEADDAYLIALDLPGVAADAVHVHYDDGVLAVSGERAQAESLTGARLVRAERGLGRFSRQFQIGTAIAPDGIEADLDEGVLTVRVPKAEVRKARQIAVGRRAPGGAVEVRATTEEPADEPVEAEAA